MENFYQRILMLRDPLARYYKAVKQNNTSRMKISVTKIQPENLNASIIPIQTNHQSNVLPVVQYLLC